MIKGTQNHKKNQFLQFSCFAKSLKKQNVFFRKLPAGGFATTKRRVLGDPRGLLREIQESKRSPERSLDEKGGFEDQLSYSELTFGGRKWSFPCLVKSDDPKTCSYGFVRCFAAIWHIPNPIFSVEVY